MTTRMKRSGGLGARAALAVGAFLAAAGHPAATAAQEAAQPLLVGPDWLAQRLGQPGLVVFHVGEPDAYPAEHVPGAVFVRTAMFSPPMPADGDHASHLVLELPGADALRSTLEGLGVSDDSRIVVVPAQGWMTPSTRIVFTLEAAGFGDRTSLLDGGLEAWKAAGHPVTAEVPTPRRGRITRPTAQRVVSADWVRENGGRDGIALLDARARAFYDGVRDDSGAVGHIPGAASLFWGDLVDEVGDVARFKPAAELRALFRQAGVEDGDTVVTYCHIGQFGTLVLFAARALGHDTRLYDGSMNEWRILDLPLEARRR